jgi:hypothetical protein
MKLYLIVALSLLFNWNGKIDIINISNKYAVTRYADSIPVNAGKLIKAYPDFIVGFSDNHLIFKDHSTMIWDDGIKNKPAKNILNKPDLKDMFLQSYEKGMLKSPPVDGFDPGRVRNEQFFLKIYGTTERAVEKNLTTIIWCPKLTGQKITVTRINGVDKRLIQISKELDAHPEWKKYLLNIGGTFAWRNISGTTRHSMHSFGMTIDVNTKYSDYWQWACHCTKEDSPVKYQNKIPQGIVDIFEKNGFIWGGKWYHYDTMHFEYRPELL